LYEDSAAIPASMRAALRDPLPGEAAHRIALPSRFIPRGIPKGAALRDAAVLIALFPDPEVESILFPLIRRPRSLAHHAGQISLPGGEKDPGESNEACAVREAHEEVGIDPATVQVLGILSPIEISVSLYQVVPVVGWIPAPPRFRLQESEAAQLLLADPDRLAAEGPKETLVHERGGRTLRFPAWNVEGEKVWGATAQILGEFIEVWRRMRARTG